MNCKEFKSLNSNDCIHIQYRTNSLKVSFEIKSYDDFNENLKLIVNMIDYLKNNNIKWVKIPLSVNYTLPVNTVIDKNDDNKYINCHIEDFEKFYLSNMQYFIKPSIIFIKKNIVEKEWTTIVDKRKEKRKKIEHLKNHVENLVTDWNSLS